MMLIHKIKPYIAQVKKLIEQRWFRITAQVFILVLCIGYLVTNLQSIKSTNLTIKLNIPMLVLSWGITILAVFLGGVGFYLTLKAFRIHVKWDEAINIHLQTNLAKYIPGYAWQLMGKAYLTRNAGVSVGLVGLAMVVELLQLVVTGLFMAFLTISSESINRLGMGKITFGVLPILWPVILAIILFFPFGINLVLKKSKRISETKPAKPLIFWGASISMFVGWLLFGYSFWLLGNALFQVHVDQLFIFIFTLSASFLIGLAVVIMPGSIGIRESIMVWLLSPVVGAPQAVILATVARVTVTLSELLSALAFKVLKRSLNNPKVLEPRVNLDGRE